MWKSHGDMQGVWLLSSVGHKGTGTVVQQGDAFNDLPTKRSGAVPCDVYISSDRYESPQIHVQETVTQWFTQPHMEFFAHEIYRLVHQRGLLSRCLLWLFVIHQLYPWALSNGFQLYMSHTYLETTCMRRYIQTEALHPKNKLYLLRRQANKKRRVNFTSIKSLRSYHQSNCRGNPPCFD